MTAPVQRHRSTQKDGATLAVLLAAILLLERFALPIGGGNELPLIVPVVLALLLVGYARGKFVLNRVQTPLVLCLWLAGLIGTIAQIGVGEIPSLLSLGLLVVLYIPLLVKSTEGERALGLAVRTFLTIMTIGAGISLAQFVIQYAGVVNIDWMAAVVPNQFLLHGFSPNALVQYGQTLRRSNGVLFLEPSFLSLYLGVAILIGIRCGTAWWQLLILLAGMVPTIAGNGIVVLIPGLLVILFSNRRRRLVSFLPGLAIVVAVAAVTPLGSHYIGRTGEASSSGSSSSFRFIQPYTRLLPESLDSPFHALFGHGAGAASTFLDAQGLEAVTTPVIPKVLFEYGGVGLLGIIAVLIVILVRGLIGKVWLVGFVIAFLFLNASLLLGELVFLTFFWLSLIPENRDQDLFDYLLRKPSMNHRHLPLKALTVTR